MQYDNPYNLECPPRFGPIPSVVSRHRLDSYKLMAKILGYDLMPWQEYFYRMASEMRHDNDNPRYSLVGLSLPRQCGKTLALLVYFVHGLLAYGKRVNILYAAQTGQDARKRLENTFMPTISDGGLDKAFGIRHRGGVIGDLYVDKTKSRLLTYGGSDTSGHGDTLNRVIIDEAMAHKDETIETAVRPAMRTVSDSQMLIVSTMGDDTSDYFNEKVDRGRALASAIAECRDPAVKQQLIDNLEYIWMEWSAPDEADIDDPAVWAACTPSLGYLIDIETIRAERQAMSEAAFRRSALNQKVHLADFDVIPRSLWYDSCAYTSSPGGYIVAGIHAHPDRSHAAIAVAGSNGNVQLVEFANGTDYIREIMLRMWKARGNTGLKKIVVLESGHYGGLEADARELDDIDVVRYSLDEYKHACGRFVERVINGSLVFENSSKLTQAVGAGVKKVTANKWQWDENATDIDTTPLVAATLAIDGSMELSKRPQIVDFAFIA